MSISKIVGDRLRSYRNQLGWSQEMLAERAGLHPTYIGQLERGEKNATIESISRIAGALGVSLSKIFENISASQATPDIPSQCYNIIQMQPAKDQEKLLMLLNEIIDYKHK